MFIRFVTALVSCALTAGSVVAAQTTAPAVDNAPVHDRQYFREIVAHQFALPAGASAFGAAGFAGFAAVTSV